MKTKFGAIITEGRGKINGFVASRNRSGSYLRTKVTPTNPSTSSQVDVRSRVSTISQAWRSLTQAQRDGWNAAVINFQGTDIFGDLRTPSGFNLFMRLNLNIINAGGASLTTAPDAISPQEFESFSAAGDASSSTLLLAFAPTPVPAGHALVIEATGPISAGRTFVKNQYRVISVLPAATATAADVGPAYESKFGDLITGKTFMVRAYLVRLSTGLTSAVLESRVLTVA